MPSFDGKMRDFLQNGLNYMAKKLLLLNGPNLNLLGTREPEVYGATTLGEVEQAAVTQAQAAGASLSHFQSNHEGALIDRIHAARTEGVNAIVINPGGLTHTSIALRDALAGVAIPFIEVHISNIYQRESFRHHSYISAIAQGTICGLGIDGYRLAIDFVLKTR
jgi:3-dehydroquinate dehydratase-2